MKDLKKDPHAKPKRPAFNKEAVVSRLPKKLQEPIIRRTPASFSRPRSLGGRR